MRNFTRLIVKRFWGLFAVLLIGLAVVVTIGRELAPQVSQYRAELETYLSDAMGVRVSIAHIAASWEGFSPELQLRGVELTSPDGEQILAVEGAVAELSLLRSLANWQLVLTKVELVDIAMGFRQNADGIWALPGLPPTTGADERFHVDDPLDMFLLADHIEFRNARFSFDFRSGHSSQVGLPHLVLENSGSFHRLRSEVAVDRSRDVLSLIIEAHGDPRQLDTFTATGNLRLKQFELDKALAALPGEWWDGLPNQEWRNEHELNLDLWFDISAGMAIDTHGRVDIGELPLDLEGSFVMPKRTTARFAGHWARNGSWKLAFRDLSLLWDEVAAPRVDMLLSSDNLGEPVHLQIAHMDLAPWFETARAVGVTKDETLAVLDTLQPSGAMRNIKLSLTGRRLDDLTLRANLDNVAVASWAGAPAIEGLDGYLEATPLAGFVDVASERGFSMYYPTIYEEALKFNSARGRVHWQIDTDKQAVKLHSGLLAMDSEAGQGRGYVSLFLPFQPGDQPEELVVQVGLRDSDARYHKQFVPTVLPDSLTAWLDQSVLAGRVNSGGLLYRGGLRRDSSNTPSIQLYLDVENAELAYHPDWPALKEADGVFWLDDQVATAQVADARLFDTRLESGTISIKRQPDQGEPLLSIAGRAAGNASDGLRFIRETPLAEVIGSQVFEGWALEGQMATLVDVTVPLQAGQQAQIKQVDVDLSEALLSTGNLSLTFEDLEGRISYSDRQGLHADQLSARLWEKPVSANISQVSAARGGRIVSLSMTGVADVGSLQEWSARPELSFLQGSSAFEAQLSIPSAAPGDLPQSQELASLTIRSEMEGIAIDLPRPLGKQADESRELTITVPLHGKDLGYHTVQYGDLLHGIVALENGGVVSAGLGLGGEASLPPARGLAVNGSVDHLNVADWQAVLERYDDLQQGEAGVIAAEAFTRSFDLQVGHFVLNGFEVEDLHLEGQEMLDRWQVAMDSTLVRGDAYLFFDPARPLLMDLEHLHLPKAEPILPEVFNPFLPPPDPRATDLLADLDPTSLPAMDIAVGDFAIGEENYGRWSFQLRPTDTGAVAREIVGSVRGGQIIGLEEGRGAQLFWDKTDGKVSSRFQGRFITDNLGHVLEQWDQPHLLDSQSSLFDARLTWPGSPAAISLTDLHGDIQMAINKGTFIRGAGETSTGSALLELIAFFNFDTWLRRLRLDFSDLTRAGTAFESMRGTLQFDYGKVYMNTPVVVKSNSSRLQMAGVVDLVDSELDTKLVATVPVGGNLTFVAALAGMGLPTVAGMWLISKVFEEQIGKMSSLSFQVTGPLNDPDMSFVRLFDDKVVQRESSQEVSELR